MRVVGAVLQAMQLALALGFAAPEHSGATGCCLVTDRGKNGLQGRAIYVPVERPNRYIEAISQPLSDL